MKNNLEHCFLACKLGSVLGRESNVYVELVAGLVADDLLLEARDKLTRTEGKLIILALAAVECDAVNEALKVDNCDIVLLGLSVVNGNDTCVSLLHGSKLFLNVVCADGSVTLVCLDTLIIVNRDFRLNGNLHRHFNAVLADLCNVKIVRSGNRLNACFFDSVADNAGIYDIKRILKEYALAVELFNHFKRSLTLTETGKLNLVLLLVIGLKNCLVEVLAAYADFKSVDVCFCFVS